MLWKTHIVGGITAGALLLPHIANNASITDKAVLLAVSGASALLPDIDDFHSKLGRAFLPVSAAIKLVCGHRGVFHSLLMVLVVYFSARYFLPQYALFIAVGYLSHLILDIFNPAGIPPFWPVSVRLSIPIIYVGGILEKLVFFGLFFSTTYYLMKGVLV